MIIRSRIICRFIVDPIIKVLLISCLVVGLIIIYWLVIYCLIRLIIYGLIVLSRILFRFVQTKTWKTTHGVYHNNNTIKIENKSIEYNEIQIYNLKPSNHNYIFYNQFINTIFCVLLDFLNRNINYIWRAPKITSKYPII